MKIYQIILALVLFNAFIYLFGVIGAFQSGYEIGVEPGDLSDKQSGWAIENIQDVLAVIGLDGIGLLGVGIFTIGTSYLAGINALTALSLGVVVGLFVNVVTKLFVGFNQIASSMGPYGFVLQAILLIVGTIIGFTLVYTVVQAGLGGGKSYD